MCTATCAQLHKRAEKITATLLERGGLNAGDNVVLLYPPGTHIPDMRVVFLSHIKSYYKILKFRVCNFFSVGVDLIAAFYGCLYAGVIPVTVRPPHPQNLAATLPTVRMIIDVSALKSKQSDSETSER